MKKKRLFGILLSLALMLTMMPALAFATGEEDVSKTEIPENNSADVEDISVQGNVPLFVGGIPVNENMDTIPGAWKEGNASVVFNEEKTEATLTLTNATIENYTIQGHDYCNIFSRGIDLTIVINGTNTLVNKENIIDNSISVCSNEGGQYGNLTIEGPGSLTTNSNRSAINTHGRCKIKSGQITATSRDYSAISAWEGFEIGAGEVTATAANDDSGIITDCDVIITGGTVTATGPDSGIYSYGGSVIANGGTIVATQVGGGTGPQSVSVADEWPDDAGIAAKNIEINNGVASLISSGKDKATDGIVKNAIPGKGWEKEDGSGTETTIAVNTSGQELSFKKVQFVAEPKPAPTPEPSANPLTVTTTAKTTTRATTIKWTWNAVDGASKYKVAYHKVGSKKWKVKSTKKTKYVLKGQKIKGLYEYKVAAVTASGDVWSDTSCRYFKTVKARAKFSKGALKVSWKKDKGAAGYEVFIARNKKMDGAQVIQVAADSNSYSVAGLENGRYYVKVRPMKNYNGVTYTGILCKARKVKVK